MIRHSGFWMLAIGVVAICLGSTGCVDRKAAEADAGRKKGTQDAADDIAKGILKQKEYPPLPYSLQQINFIRLLKSECDVVTEVVNGRPDSPALRAEVAAYNDVMRGAIHQKFGADIFQKLREKADAK